MSNAKQKFKENGKNMDAYAGYIPEEKEHKKRAQRQNNNGGKRPAKMKPITYTFSAESEYAFSIVKDTMCGACQAVNTFFTNAAEHHPDFELNTFDDYVVAAMCEFTEYHTPQLLEKINIHSSINVTANKLNIRLEGGVGFSIEVRYEIVNKAAKIIAATGSVTLYAPNDKLVASLEEAGFTVFVKQNRR